MARFRALVADGNEDAPAVRIDELTLSDLPAGDVTISVSYSSVNYKDGLAVSPKSRVVRRYPMVLGIDLAGVVIHSTDRRLHAGDEVLVTGYDLGVSHFGGFSQVARVPAEWVVPLPKGLTLRDAMAFGTAGFTAALSIDRMEQNGLGTDAGPVLVTGATGGVGSLAVAILSQLGYEVTASSRKEGEAEYLRHLGAAVTVTPDSFMNGENRPLRGEIWAGVVDPVGGESLASILPAVKYGGSVALSGLAGGWRFATTVHPFILRGVNLLGIDSVQCPMDTRRRIWDRLATDMKPIGKFDLATVAATLDDVPGMLSKILKSEVRGRVVVSL